MALGLALAACAANGPPMPAAVELAMLGGCTLHGGPGTAAQRAQWLELQRSIESAPLFAALDAAPVARCRVSLGEAGATEVEYRFADGGRLLVRHDRRIEVYEQSAEFAAPPERNPQMLLAAAERAAFGNGGCGIDWQHAERQSAGGVEELVYRSQACNCQATIRRGAGGQVVALSLKSAC